MSRARREARSKVGAPGSFLLAALYALAGHQRRRSENKNPKTYDQPSKLRVSTQEKALSAEWSVRDACHGGVDGEKARLRGDVGGVVAGIRIRSSPFLLHAPPQGSDCWGKETAADDLASPNADKERN